MPYSGTVCRTSIVVDVLTDTIYSILYDVLDDTIILYRIWIYRRGRRSAFVELNHGYTTERRTGSAFVENTRYNINK